eukprot:m.32424 g.32424  ORF g.32424 m.32424 type:complete len:124 (+) comp5528_c0_seq2:234-605(+)
MQCLQAGNTLCALFANGRVQFLFPQDAAAAVFRQLPLTEVAGQRLLRHFLSSGPFASPVCCPAACGWSECLPVLTAFVFAVFPAGEDERRNFISRVMTNRLQSATSGSAFCHVAPPECSISSL